MKQALTLLVILVAGAALTFWLVNSNDSDDNGDANRDDNNVETNTDSTSGAIDYVNGTYSREITYSVPQDFTDKIEVTITLEDDMITSVAIAEEASNDLSEDYIERFTSAVEGDVVGKDIDSVSLSRTGGASLTSEAFNEALEEIKVDAQV